MIKQLIINNKKSYDDFGVYIATRNISSPKKKVIKESIPFSNVVYDFSKINGELYWEERTLQYTFDIAEITTEQMEEAKSNLLNWLLNVHDVDIYDPYIGDYHFHGSYDSDSWSEDFGAGTISVTFTVYPYKISNSDINKIEVLGDCEGEVIENNVVSKVEYLNINGKSIQEDTPTLETKADIISLGALNDNQVEVKVTGKNLLNIYEIESNTADVYEVLEDDWIHYANTSGSAKRVFFKPFKVKPNTTYFINYELQEGLGEDITFFYLCDKDKNTVSTTIYPSSSIHVTTTEKTEYAKVGITTQSQSAIDDFKIRLMVVENKNMDTVYEAHKSNSCLIDLKTYDEEGLESGFNEVCSINDITDELILKENSAKIIKKFKKLILTGDEKNYIFVGQNSDENYIQINLYLNPGNVDSKNDGSYILCTHFPYYKNASDVGKTQSGIKTYSTNTLVFSMPTEIASDLTSWKEYVKEQYNNGTPITIYYLLNEYYETELEGVSLPSTFKGNSYVTIDAGMHSTFEVYYNETKNITINNNSSHRISPTITSTGSFNIKLNNVSYSIGEGTYNNAFYLETGENKLTLTGYGEITFSYVEEMF